MVNGDIRAAKTEWYRYGRNLCDARPAKIPELLRNIETSQDWTEEQESFSQKWSLSDEHCHGG